MSDTESISCNHIFKCYCFSCETLLCDECSRSRHSNHKFISFLNDNDTIDINELNIINDLLEEYNLQPIEMINNIDEYEYPDLETTENLANGEGWKCKNCTSINSIHNNKCEICHNFYLINEDAFENKLKYCVPNIIKNLKILEDENIGSMELICDEYIKSKSKDTIMNWFSNDFIKSRDPKSVFSIMERQIHLNGETNWRDDYIKTLKKQNEKLESCFEDVEEIKKLLNSEEPVPLFQINKCVEIDDEIKNHVCEVTYLLELLKSEELNESQKRLLAVEMNIKETEKLNLLINTFKDPSMSHFIIDSLKDGTLNLDILQTAVKDNIELESIQKYLMNNCDICCGIFPASMMKHMLICSHQICVECFVSAFTEMIDVKSPNLWSCPCCSDSVDENVERDPSLIQIFYNNISERFQELIDWYRCNKESVIVKKLENSLVMFNQKLNEQRIMLEPDFHWCPNEKCSYGFLSGVEGKLECSQCKEQLCGRCNRKWQKVHENKTCDEVERIMLMENPDLNKVLNDIGIECPNCRMRYALAPGGCLHFDCKQCQKMFCGGCSNYFVKKCEVPTCAMTDFHAHHPRNCIYFLRDESPDLLAKMLQNKEYKKLDNEPNQKCKMLLVGKDMKDKPCDEEVYTKTGFCELHYKEYLITLINRYQIDPIEFYDTKKLNLTLFQAKVPQLTPINNETEDQFRLRLIQEIKAKCPFYIPKASQKPDSIKTVDPEM